ncbi:hypothetical protein CDAR_288141 [Caerostris darwini]|uniref:EGF-like domain-containing protein n=1 Tax=Caerostris darwini TaxID=1538125 RepID=A0AAV4PLM4_9ARAC|nr:hypothetical protein CDAR_288141 [Caerostris darwini]
MWCRAELLSLNNTKREEFYVQARVYSLSNDTLDGSNYSENGDENIIDNIFQDTLSYDDTNDTDVCNPNKCVHGDCMKSGTDGFSCNCEGPYSGFLCDEKNEFIRYSIKRITFIWAISFGVLFVILLIIVGVFIAVLRNHKKMNSSYIDDRCREIPYQSPAARA